ncbi:hypothetical protein B0H10DRAFT_1975908 [Mycena sp. CBHHK59/15]|nr:hypothetical protein B0H10DRAFT_1975908 [Mycena sp. CBHHK59/15]
MPPFSLHLRLPTARLSHPFLVPGPFSLPPCFSALPSLSCPSTLLLLVLRRCSSSSPPSAHSILYVGDLLPSSRCASHLPRTPSSSPPCSVSLSLVSLFLAFPRSPRSPRSPASLPLTVRVISVPPSLLLPSLLPLLFPCPLTSCTFPSSPPLVSTARLPLPPRLYLSRPLLPALASPHFPLSRIPLSPPYPLPLHCGIHVLPPPPLSFLPALRRCPFHIFLSQHLPPTHLSRLFPP